MTTKEQSVGSMLKKAVENYGSINKATEALLAQKKQLEGEVAAEEEKLALLHQSLQQAVANLEKQRAQASEASVNLAQLAQKFTDAGKQYQLYEGFLAMMGTSPSVQGKIHTSQYLKLLAESEWFINTTLEKARGMFIRAVMGDYLRCFRCEGCGAEFIVNRDPKRATLHQGFTCPACGFNHQIIPDNSFLKAMLSEEQVDNVIKTEAVLTENKQLIPFKQLLGHHCEICKQPVSEWTFETVKLGVDGYGWGHEKCWNSAAGRMILVAKTLVMTRKPK